MTQAGNADGRVTLEVASRIGTITLDRPAKHNAITPAMAAQLADACRAVDADPEVRVVVVRGGGERAFSAGSDLNALGEVQGVWAFRNRTEYAAVVRAIRKPVVAQLRGWVLGGGLEIAIAADVRIAGRSSKLGAPEVTRGWVGGGGASQVVPRLAGMGRAMHLLLGGHHVTAEQALAMGLVEEVVDDAELEARVQAYAAIVAGHSAVATQAVKAAVRAAAEMPLTSGLQYENELHVVCMQEKDRAEGIAAFQQKRDANF
ncbi:MAG: enoyl-CoA hydratase/isomerase family protein [Comamonadaceae bacterium]|nr:MAG: enoyl-CoA hydratase/isomerase family protein [Comamonadaceae bacterium]